METWKREEVFIHVCCWSIEGLISGSLLISDVQGFLLPIERRLLKVLGRVWDYCMRKIFFSGLMHQSFPSRVSVCYKCAVLALFGALYIGWIQSAGLDHKNHNQTISVDKCITLAKSIYFVFTEKHISEEVTDSHGFC